MGGHGHDHLAGNANNYQESDEEMQGKIQRIDLIKYNPNFFHLDPFNFENISTIIGGAPTFALGTVGAVFSYAYYAGQARPYNFYANNFRAFGRLSFGMVLGLGLGYKFFGDRQRLHNAYVAERLRRRYPESMGLNTKDLWQYKGIKAPHPFYRWV